MLKHTRDSTNVSVDNFYKQKQIIDNLVDKGVNTPRLIGIENLDIKISDSDGVSIKLKDEYKNKIIEQTKQELEAKRNEVLNEMKEK